MLIRRAFKFELKPDGRQACQIGKFCGCARYVYNRTLSLEKSLYAKDDKHSFRYTEATKRLPEWKNKHPFLKECHSQVLQQSLKDLDRAYTNFFEKRANFPKYRKKFRHDSIRFPQGVELDEVKQKIRLPKIGWVGYRKSQDIIGTIKNIQALKDAEARRESKERQLLLQSRCDPMTQLLNRSAMQQAIEEQINSQTAYMFSIIDIDDFKSINDKHGHVFGDEVLKYVADVLRNACRSDDITGRLGGDEFVMLFRADVTRDEAARRLVAIIERIREGVGTLSIEAGVSVSIGAILVTRPGLSFLDVYRSADAALYEAKHKGKKTYSLDVY